MWEWVPAAISVAGMIAVAVIGGKASRRTAYVTATTPAYAELLSEVQSYRGEAREDRERIEHLERAYDDERKLRRELDSRVACLERAKDADRSWIRRTIERIATELPAHLDLLRPFPDWHTDPDMPAIPRPPDDGQPHNLNRR